VIVPEAAVDAIAETVVDGEVRARLARSWTHVLTDGRTSLGLSALGAAWSAIAGDPVSGLLGATQAAIAQSQASSPGPPSPTGVYSYLFSIDGLRQG